MTAAAWPVDLVGVVESVVTTRGPNDRWNVAALGLHAGDDHDRSDPVRARTWGATRTRRNFERQSRGYVQFVRDPLVFVEAALDVTETDEPVLDATAAWAEVDVTRVHAGESGGTEWVDWHLRPVDAAAERRSVPTVDRALGAVVELTVAASRLGVPTYDDERLRERMDYFAEVARNCGGQRTDAAVDRTIELSEWDPAADRSPPGTTAESRPRTGE